MINKDDYSEKKKILILGVRGCLGHVLQAYLKEKGFSVVGLGRKQIDVSNFTELDNLILDIGPDVIVNCVGILKPKSVDPELNAKINVALPWFLTHICERNSSNGKYTKLLNISTNCSFEDIGPHYPDEQPNAKDLYGVTKGLGEIKSSPNVLTIRTSFAGPELKDGVNLFHWFVNKTGKEVTGYTNAYWNGVTTLELSKFIEECIVNDYRGIVNYYSRDTVSKHELLNIINEVYTLGKKVNATELAGVHSSLLIGPTFTVKPLIEQFAELKAWTISKNSD
jgi:dTDP-4-dehydrorhamnose reductase